MIATRRTYLARQNVRLMEDRHAAHPASHGDVDSPERLAIQAQESLAIARIDPLLARSEEYRSLDTQDFPAMLLAAVAGEQPNRRELLSLTI